MAAVTSKIHRSPAPPAGQTTVQQDSAKSARTAGLQYVSDSDAGLRRVNRGQGFSYLDATGSQVHDKDVLDRIASLAIPPAWTDVWICASSRGHLQATGRDERGRKQYRYHRRWREVRDEAKYDRLIAFGHALPTIRARTSADIALRGLPRAKVLAVVIQLLEGTLIRIGNEEYARENHSFGLTTMRTRHVDVDGSQVTFEFNGKSGKKHAVGIHDRRIARVVSSMRELPGQELFQYVDHDGARHSISSDDVNDYLKHVTGDEFTAKDFRTWAGTVLAARELSERGVCADDRKVTANIVSAIESVAKRLGNTPAICRKCYVHPAVIDAYRDGSMAETLASHAKQHLEKPLNQLEPEEATVMLILQQRSTDGPAPATG